MDDDPYSDDSDGYDPTEPPPHSHSPSEVELRVQHMLDQQLATDVTLEQQAAKHKSFTLAAVTFRPFIEQASGQLSLEDFEALEREHGELEELRACGLSDEEIALKLENEGRPLSRLIPPYKRGRFVVDPTARAERLKVIEEKIKKKRASLCVSPQEATPSHQTESPGSAENQAGGDRTSSHSDLRHPTTLGTKYIHPDDPINHLDAIATRLFSKSNKDKQDGNVSTRIGNVTSHVGRLAGGCSPGCHDDSCHTKEKELLPNEDLSKEESTNAFRKGLKAGCTFVSDGNNTGRDFITMHGEMAPHVREIGNLSNTPHGGPNPEGPAKEGILDIAAGGLGAEQQSQSVPRVGEECTGTQGEDYQPRKLASTIRPLSREDLLEQRLRQEDICRMDRFADYSPGQPSKVLYLKNLSSKVTEADLASVFISFQQPDKPKLIFKLLKGKMRGQAFVTFPDAEMAAEAMEHVNGYPLRGKPVIIQYGKNR